MKKKFISLLLAVAALAALAIPASAASTATNETTISFSYKSDKTIDADNKDSVYTITIPAQIDLTLGEEKGNDGVTFSGTGYITVSGLIGQQDYVEVSVGSSGHYTLTGDGASAGYKMNATADSTSTTIIKSELSQSNTTVNSNDKLFKSAALAFRNNDIVTLNFASDGANNIYGKCNVTDKLTFTYQYAAINDNGGYNVTSGTAANTFEQTADGKLSQGG